MPIRIGREAEILWYGFSANGCTHAYLGGFDPALHRCSIGWVTIGHAMEQGTARGIREIRIPAGQGSIRARLGRDGPRRRGAAMTAYQRFGVTLEVEIRACTADDLPKLEWHGMFTLQRPLMNEAYERQTRGQGLMLLAVANDFPIGQAWIDFDARPDERGVAVIWAVRVYPFLQGGGIGGRLLAAAEQAIRERGYRTAELGVEKNNPRARRLYERTGYRLHREMVEELRYHDWNGDPVVEQVDQWMLRKDVRRAAPEHASTTNLAR